MGLSSKIIQRRNIISFLAVLLIWCAYSFSGHDNGVIQTVLKELGNAVNGPRSPLILFVGRRDAPEPECPFKCDYKTSKIPTNEADVVVFGGPVQHGKRENTRQIWVFSVWESPHYYGFSHFPMEDVYNWTMTFRRDSDVVQSYGFFRPKKNSFVSVELFQNLSSHSLKLGTNKLKKFKKYLKGRKKLIGWASSRRSCTTPSKREVLIDLIEKFIPVDKYGSCGKLKCKAKRLSPQYRQCFEQLGKEYKFYLSFENSLCKDYVSEKFFAPLKNDMVPIVYGDGEYAVVGPPGSYIDPRSFATIQELTQHIKMLDEQPEEYLKYFLWKDYYEVLTSPEPNRFCDLCQKFWEHSVTDELGNRILDPSYTKIIPNISTWYAYKPQKDPKENLEPSCHPPLSSPKLS